MKSEFNLFIVIALVLTIGCGSKKESQNVISSDSVISKTNEVEEPMNFNGEYEYDGGSQDNSIGYLYQKLIVNQKGDSISGSLFSGLYLSRSEAGGYIMPETAIETPLTGGRTDGTNLIFDLGDSDITKLEEGHSAYPYFLKIFQEDADGNMYLLCEPQNDDLKISSMYSDEPEIIFVRMKR